MEKTPLDFDSVSANLPQWQREFPDYEPATLPAIPDGWQDVSWHNDTCPSFVAAPGLFCFVDYADESRRELPGERFVLLGRDKHGEHVQSAAVMASDDWSEVLSFVYRTAALPCAAFKPIGDIAEAVEFIGQMERAGLAWHWEDSADSIVLFSDEEMLFPGAAATLLEKRRAELYALQWPAGDCPCGVSLAFGHRRGEYVCDEPTPLQAEIIAGKPLTVSK